VRGSIESAGSVLREFFGSGSEEEEEEIVGAREQIVGVTLTEQIAPGDGGSGRIETMEEVRQLERVTVAAGALTIESVEDALVAVLAMRMQWCWISTI
jgi:hypothetical protein